MPKDPADHVTDDADGAALRGAAPAQAATGSGGLRREGIDGTVTGPGMRPTRIARFERTPGAPAVLDEAVDVVAVEEPLEIRLAWPDVEAPDGQREQSISITMRTPGHDLELAVGFLYGEGIVNAPGQVASVDHCGPPVGPHLLRNVVKVVLSDASGLDLARLERHFYTTSSCGVCGKTSLEALRVQTHHAIPGTPVAMDAADLGALPQALRRHQEVFGRTGGIHAAALFDAQGTVLAVREDVGRHNALDKLVGAQFLAGNLPLGRYGILVSGRASFELMQKAVMAGAGMLAAVGAPSTLAVELARDFGVVLVGFLRDFRFNVYAGSERLALADAGARPTSPADQTDVQGNDDEATHTR